MQTRPAQPSDAAFATPLLLEAYGPLALALTATNSVTEATQVLEEWFASNFGRLGYGATLVALNQAGEPVGLLLRYAGSDSAALDQPIRQYLRQKGRPADFPSEGQAGELYLDALAVAPAARGQGVGRTLLEAAKAEAIARELSGAALLVEPSNPAARLYARAGFVPRGELLLSGYTQPHRELFWAAHTALRSNT